MATANISWTACGSSSDGQYLYYGKSTIVTGTPISGTGWTLYTGSALPNTASSAVINGLDDNVEYNYNIYCHCPSAGNGPISTQGPLIKYVCPSVTLLTPTYNGLSYTITVPNSSNNVGSWIQTIVVSAYDSSNINLITSNTYTAPFNSTISGNFSSLNPSTNYNIQIAYSNNAKSRTQSCSSTPFTTAAACVAPTVTLNNATSNTFDVSWTPTTGGTFDILVNSSVVASGLTTGPYTVTGLNAATIYQVNVRKNCATGGSAISTAQNITTTNATITGTLSLNSSTAPDQGQQGTMYLIFNFATPTAIPITLYFGSLDTCTVCPSPNSYATGYNLFTIPSGSVPNTSGYYYDASQPFVVNIPSGVTTYNSGTSISPLGTNPAGRVWIHTALEHTTDLYVRVNSPSGYSANFSIANGVNVTGVTLHNV